MFDMGNNTTVSLTLSQPIARPAQDADRPARVVAIINPVSCPLGIDEMKRNVAAALEGHGIVAEYFETCESETALSIAAREIERGAALLLAVGGDGTIMETINAVIGKNVPVGIIPAGTGNLLAANLGIPTTIADAVDVALDGRALLLDLVALDGGKKYFAIMGGLGYDAEIMRDTSREVKRKIGKLAYLWTALKDIRGKRFSVDLLLDDKRRIRAIAKSLLIANMGELVKGVNLFTDADPTDGVIDVGILKASSVPAFFQLIWHTFRGKPQESVFFDRYTARKVIVATRRSVPLELDGDDMGDTAGFTAEVLPKAAHVMVPATS